MSSSWMVIAPPAPLACLLALYLVLASSLVVQGAPLSTTYYVAPTTTAAAIATMTPVSPAGKFWHPLVQQNGKPVPLTTCQETILFQATNLYENDQTAFDYAYCENIRDGRGYTAGISGFCTGTHDALMVIKRYLAMPGNGGEFVPYLKTLAELDKKSGTSGSTKGLSGYCAAWKRAAVNKVFRAAQLAEMRASYYNPSQRLADKLGLSLPLARGQLYDAAIQHGLDDSATNVDPDSLNALITRATAKAGGTPAGGKVSDAKWLTAFLQVRLYNLCHPADKGSQHVWCQSINRVKSYQYALAHESGIFTSKLILLNNDLKPVTLTCAKSLV